MTESKYQEAIRLITELEFSPADFATWMDGQVMKLHPSGVEKLLEVFKEARCKGTGRSKVKTWQDTVLTGLRWYKLTHCEAREAQAKATWTALLDKIREDNPDMWRESEYWESLRNEAGK